MNQDVEVGWEESMVTFSRHAKCFARRHLPGIVSIGIITRLIFGSRCGQRPVRWSRKFSDCREQLAAGNSAERRLRFVWSPARAAIDGQEPVKKQL